MNLNRTRIKIIDQLRGFAAIMMILGHSFIEYPVDISNVGWCAFVQHFIYTFHMELFFVLAGAVYDCSDYKTYAVKKVQRITVPYFFFGSLTLMLRAFGGSLINGVEPIGLGIRKLVLFGGGYWFLYVMFLILMIYPLIDRYVSAKGKLCLAALCMLAWGFAELPSLFQINGVVHYLPYFIIGNLAVAFFRERTDLNGKHKMLLVLSCMVIYIILDKLDRNSLMNPILRYPRALAFILILFVFITSIWEKIAAKKPFAFIDRLMTDCSRFSLQLYVFNGYILTVVRVILCNILDITQPAVLVILIWLSNIIITLVACKRIIPHIPMMCSLCGITQSKLRQKACI